MLTTTYCLGTYHRKLHESIITVVFIPIKVEMVKWFYLKDSGMVKCLEIREHVCMPVRQQNGSKMAATWQVYEYHNNSPQDYDSVLRHKKK